MTGLTKLIAIAGMLIALSTSSRAIAQTKDVLQVSLRNSAINSQKIVRLEHVAILQHSSAELKSRIGNLDLHELVNGKAFVITQSHIKIRLLLAGLRSDQFELAGPKAITVKALGGASALPIAKNNLDSSLQANLEASIKAAVRKNMAKAFSIQEEHVIVSLNSSLNKREMEPLAQLDLTELDFEMLGGGSESLGSRRLRFVVRRSGETESIINLHTQTSIIIEKPVAKVAINSGDVFSEENVTFQKSETNVPGFDLITAARIYGKRARRNISVGSSISANSIQSQTANSPTRTLSVVKSRDPVTVLARVGGVAVRLNNATALQAGAVGDLVRVRNEDSQKIITCRVVAANQVETIVFR